MKGEQDMERQTPKNENTEFKDLPDVKIDPEKEAPSQKHFSKKTGIDSSMPNHRKKKHRKKQKKNQRIRHHRRL